MYCAACGDPLLLGALFCSKCGVKVGGERTGEQIRVTLQDAESIRGCPGCGHRGRGVRYFSRTGHKVLLGAVTIFTYGTLGLAYWLLKRHARICPSCGMDWTRSEPLGVGSRVRASPVVPPRAEISPREEWSRSGAGSEPLPGDGGIRRFAGGGLLLTTPLIIASGLSPFAPEAFMVGGVVAAGGGWMYWWGKESRLRRREALMNQVRRDVLELARTRGGTLTATDVATATGLSLTAAERVLFSMDDGFRVRSEVTETGVILFEFPELILRNG
jgi:hypothetical protein